ncbi:hypothetical protein PR048_028267 [Dryococelus australis]|uniref:Uncharacterized protein n=1 Tax=Dryococelus australis TaxID=614101 RepID=A0ABQ9GIS4_9NEOP|nr:hypothetical protein PR048_028267 [Dryococelus australis]
MMDKCFSGEDLIRTLDDVKVCASHHLMTGERRATNSGLLVPHTPPHNDNCLSEEQFVACGHHGVASRGSAVACIIQFLPEGADDGDFVNLANFGGEVIVDDNVGMDGDVTFENIPAGADPVMTNRMEFHAIQLTLSTRQDVLLGGQTVRARAQATCEDSSMKLNENHALMSCCAACLLGQLPAGGIDIDNCNHADDDDDYNESDEDDDEGSGSSEGDEDYAD